MGVVATAVSGAFLRVWHINSLGFNSDEAVYAGQAASIAGDPTLKAIFPIFRAHPLLFQFVLSMSYQFGVSDLSGRLLAVGFAMATLLVVYHLGTLLYDRKTGLVAALFVALMPYHVIVSRQALLDVPMTLFATLTLFLLARFAKTKRPAYLYATGAALGLAFLSKETAIIFLPAIYAFLALSPAIRVRVRDMGLSLLAFVLVILPFPMSLKLGGATDTAHNFLVWQLFRPANHSWSFYLTVVPAAIGVLLVVLAVYGLRAAPRQEGWERRLLLSWMIVPFAFFELWPVKGFQYLLPAAPAIALLAAAAVVHGFRITALNIRRRHLSFGWLRPVVLGIVAISLCLSSWARVNAVDSGRFLAGSGGVPGGREAGRWVLHHVPEGGKMLAIGPSMANIIAFYGHRSVYGLSVSPNPLHRNPAYEPIHNPDLLLRNGEIQYVVWDAFSAERSQFFAAKVLHYARRYNGRVVHSESVDVATAEGKADSKPIIIIYQVRP